MICLALTLLATTGQAVVRTSYILTELSAYNSKLPATKRNEKYLEMEADPFAFFRGTNHLYWKDLGKSSSLVTYSSTSTKCWLSGDAHVRNIGAFSNDAGTVVFDLNDFDESVIADYQLDVWRMAISINLMMRVNGGFSAADRSAVVDEFTESYLDTIEAYATTSAEKTAVVTVSNAYGQLDEFLADVKADESRLAMLDEFTVKVNGVRRFKTTAQNPDLGPVTSAEYTAVVNAMTSYGLTLSGGLGYSGAHFAVKSVAERLHAGIGSLGNKRFYILIQGPSTNQDDDVILDMKAQDAPSAFLNLATADVTKTNTVTGSNAGQRVTKAYKALSYKADDYLGYTTVTIGGTAQVYSVRERNPHKKNFDTTALATVNSATNMAQQWGKILATAHSRSDLDADPAVISHNFDSAVKTKIDGKHAEFRALVRSIIEPYAIQVIDDYNSFLAIRANGQLSATTDEDALPQEPQTIGLDAAGIAGIISGAAAVFLVGGLAAVVVRRRRSRNVADSENGHMSPSSSEKDEPARLESSNPAFHHPSITV